MSKYRVGPEPHVCKRFDELSPVERLRRTLYGLRRPQDTGDHKWAKLQVLRLWAPVLAILIPALAVIIMFVLSKLVPEETPLQEVTLAEAAPLEPMLEIIKLMDIDPPPETTSLVEVLVENPVEPAAEYSDPQPALDQSVTLNQSRLVFPNVMTTVRQPEAQAEARKQYDCPPQADAAVIRALRWLKQVQEPDGSWKANSGGGNAVGDSYQPAMTGLALLCFLGHGETPASEEYGQTVQKAITWLMKNQQKDGTFAHSEAKNYSLAIGAYALSEAYTMTQVPSVKKAAEQSVKRMLKMQHTRGGWYWYSKGNNEYLFDNKNTGQDDTSLTGWCVQALKAAKIAGLHVGPMDAVLKKAGASLRGNATSGGPFVYLSGGNNQAPGGANGLTAVGVLGLQILGLNKSPEAQRGLEYLSSRATCDWENPWGKPWSIYYWYYLTQANFHAGGEKWSSWNRTFSVQIPGAQKTDGEDRGYWDSIDNVESRVYATTLCTLMLEVYYRVSVHGAADDGPAGIQRNDDGIDIQIGGGV